MNLKSIMRNILKKIFFRLVYEMSKEELINYLDSLNYMILKDGKKSLKL